MTSIAFTKGHGTQNDFVLIDDSKNQLNLSEDLVRHLADRRAGLGADGVIRVVRTKDIVASESIDNIDEAAEWFMDYRNADGSIAQMCGNGVRVFAAFLEHLGYVDFSAAESIPIGTRAGTRTMTKNGDWFSVGMGDYSFIFPDAAVDNAMDSTVRIEGIAGVGENDLRPALSVSMGNPHTVVALNSLEELSRVDFARAPQVQPIPPEGTNVEVVVPLEPVTLSDGRVAGHIAMRVHERGVGETKSCGTGACAAAVAVRHWSLQSAGQSEVPDVWQVDIPGGTVVVTIEGRAISLSGPAVLVAQGVVDTNALTAS